LAGAAGASPVLESVVPAVGAGDLSPSAGAFWHPVSKPNVRTTAKRDTHYESELCTPNILLSAGLMPLQI